MPCAPIGPSIPCILHNHCIIITSSHSQTLENPADLETFWTSWCWWSGRSWWSLIRCVKKINGKRFEPCTYAHNNSWISWRSYPSLLPSWALENTAQFIRKQDPQKNKKIILTFSPSSPGSPGKPGSPRGPCD